MIISVMLAGSLLLLSILVLYYRCCKNVPLNVKAPEEQRNSETINVKDADEGQDNQIALSLIDTTNLTDNEIIEMKSYCNDCNKIGEGSFGKVYKGNCSGSEMAIKKIERTSSDSRTLVENEVKLMQGKHHKNLVSLIGWCIEEHVFYLMYEYVNGCTLQACLKENCLRTGLGWKQCFKLIQGIAEGIQFLHKNKIIHVDIKPQNLVLDSAGETIKIIDFGFSRHENWQGMHKSTVNVIGTRGYWAPEYCLDHKLSYKHDVYSFGIVVLEVITGQKHIDHERESSQFHISEYVKYMMATNRFEEAVDERTKHGGWDGDDVKNAKAVAELALNCGARDKNERPDMHSLVKSLNTVGIQRDEEEASGMYLSWDSSSL